MTFFHIDLLLKLNSLFEKAKIKWKIGRGWPIFWKELDEGGNNKNTHGLGKGFSVFMAVEKSDWCIYNT